MTESGIRDLVGRMTLEEKASLCSGRDFWTTKAIERLGIRSWTMTDGPHGLRKQSTDNDHLGLNRSVPATCFPTATGLGASWNRDLLKELGEALGEECQANGVGTILGPGVNIKRSPLCGRNFEYFSEDPYLAGELAASHIQGVQSRGVGTSLKHFAANNQERLRMTIDTIVDERTLREIYLPAFETAVRKAKPWTVMCAYNKLNGTYCSEHRWLLTEVLRDEWGFDGVVVTDWGASNDRPAGVAAGTDLEMPASGGAGDTALVEAVRSGRLAEAVLDEAVVRNLRLYFRVAEGSAPGAVTDLAAHHELARRIAGECAVLLKNENELLPLAPEGRIAFIGAFAKSPRYQGTGSSRVNPWKLDCAWDEALRILPEGEAVWAAGYDPESDTTVDSLKEEAVALAASSRVTILFVGLTDQYESEGYDRKHLRMPASHVELIEAVAAAQKNLVVVLNNGAPVEMPWLDRAGAVLEGYLGGQAGGSAIVDILFGATNPSGKLAETFPERLEDTSSRLYFPGGTREVEYREGIFVGYRYFASAGVRPLFPFGHGLSYTRFEYEGLQLDRDRMCDDEILKVAVRVRNSGEMRGKEIVQLYVRENEPGVPRPVRELRGFVKLDLAPGETGLATFELDKRAFARWDRNENDWVVDEGEYEILIGASSEDIRLSTPVHLRRATPPARRYSRNTTIGEVVGHPDCGKFVRGAKESLMKALAGEDLGSSAALMMEAMIDELPLRNLGMLSGDASDRAMIETLVKVLNEDLPSEALAGSR